MKLLLDQNLSHRIIGQVEELFPGSSHVKRHGLSDAEDEEVWQFARQNNFVLVSKDSDFHHRSLLRGPPPKFIYLRVGNCSTAHIVGILRASSALIEQFMKSALESILILS